mgnify:CR=1 FL=1
MTATDEVVLVLNAGSSSVKFCAFTRSRGGLERGLRGQVAGIGTAPHLAARSGPDLVADRSLGGDALSHADVLGSLKALIAEHPTHERFHSQRMLALYRAGSLATALQQPSAARNWFERLVSLDPEFKDARAKLLQLET